MNQTTSNARIVHGRSPDSDPPRPGRGAAPRCHGGRHRGLFPEPGADRGPGRRAPPPVHRGTAHGRRGALRRLRRGAGALQPVAGHGDDPDNRGPPGPGVRRDVPCPGPGPGPAHPGPAPRRPHHGAGDHGGDHRRGPRTGRRPGSGPGALRAGRTRASRAHGRDGAGAAGSRRARETTDRGGAHRRLAVGDRRLTGTAGRLRRDAHPGLAAALPGQRDPDRAGPRPHPPRHPTAAARTDGRPTKGPTVTATARPPLVPLRRPPLPGRAAGGTYLGAGQDREVVPLAADQGTLALDLDRIPEAPGTADLRVVADRAPTEPGEAGESTEPVDPGPAEQAEHAEQAQLRAWAARFAQATVEVLGGDRPVAQLLRWTNARVYTDLTRRVRTLGRTSPAPTRLRTVRPQVHSVRVCRPAPRAAEVSVHVRHGDRSRAIAARLEQRNGRWTCVELQLG